MKTPLVVTTSAAYDEHVAPLVTDGVASAGCRGRRRSGGRTPRPRPRSGSDGSTLPHVLAAAARRDRRPAGRAVVRGSRPGRALRHGRLVAGARGHHADVPGASRRSSTRRTPASIRRAVLRDLSSTVVVVSSKSGGTLETDSQRRAFVAAFEAAGIDAGLANRRRDRPRHRPRAARPRARLSARLPRRPARRRPIQRADRLRTGPVRPGRRRHRRAARRGGRGHGRGARRRRSTTPRLVLGAAWAAAAGRDKIAIADAGSGIVVVPRLGRAADRRVAPASWATASCRSASRGSRRPRSGGPPRDVVASAIMPPSDDAADAAGGLGDPWATVTGPLGAQLLLWEVATAVAGRLLGINPFDQPDVESAKAAARGLLEAQPEEDPPAITEDGIDVALGAGAARRRRHARRRDRARCWPAGPTTATCAVMAYLDCRARRRLYARPRLARPPHRTPDHLRLGTALPALDRPVPQGRPAAGRLPPDHLRRGRRHRDPRSSVQLRDPDHRAGGRRRVRAGRSWPAGPSAPPARPDDRSRRRWSRRCDDPSAPCFGGRRKPAPRPAGPPAAADRRAVRPRHLRRHRRPGAQEADAGGLRPGQPGAAAAGLLARRVRPARLGATRTSRRSCTTP